MNHTIRTILALALITTTLSAHKLDHSKIHSLFSPEKMNDKPPQLHSPKVIVDLLTSPLKAIGHGDALAHAIMTIDTTEAERVELWKHFVQRAISVTTKDKFFNNMLSEASPRTIERHRNENFDTWEQIRWASFATVCGGLLSTLQINLKASVALGFATGTLVFAIELISHLARHKYEPEIEHAVANVRYIVKTYGNKMPESVNSLLTHAMRSFSHRAEYNLASLLTLYRQTNSEYYGEPTLQMKYDALVGSNPS